MNLTKIGLISATSFVLLLSFQNCSPMQGEQENNSSTQSPLSANFNDIFNRIVQPKCVGCHSSSLPGGGIDLSSYEAISTSGTVVPGNSGLSTFYTSMITGRMPPLDKLDFEDVVVIGSWINDGAKNTNGEVFNKPPSVNAGKDQYIYAPQSTVTLQGLASDADGEVISTLWVQISGPKNLTITNSISLTSVVTGIDMLGNYEFELQATDNKGAKSVDRVIISLNPFNNLLPVVSAGLDKNIQSPEYSTSITAYAADSDGFIESYIWNQVSGPSSATLSGAATNIVTVSNLMLGTYEFQITVTDNKGGTASDKVKVAVDPAPKPQSYNNINETIFKPKCLSCHRDGNERGGYNMSSYSKTMMGVVSNNANASVLFMRVHDLSMPPGSALGKPDRDKIRDWINTGALNN